MSGVSGQGVPEVLAALWPQSQRRRQARTPVAA